MLTVIIGPPGSGKTTLARKIKESAGAGYTYVMHTDDYIDKEKGFMMRLNSIMQMYTPNKNIVIEGCWAVRYLNDMVKRGIIPDKIIKMETPLDICIERYEEREAKKYPKSMYGMVNTTFTNFILDLREDIRVKLDIQTVG